VIGEEEAQDNNERNSEAEETETDIESESENDCSGENEMIHSTSSTTNTNSDSKVVSSFQGGYAHIQQYVATTIKTSNTLIIMPAYIQLDHVDGNLC